MHGANCGQLGHPANYRGCPAFDKYILQRRERMVLPKGEAQRRGHLDRGRLEHIVRDGVSFRDMLAACRGARETGQTYGHRGRGYVGRGNFCRMSERLLGRPLSEIVREVNDFMSRIERINFGE